MNIKRILIPLLLILFMASMAAFGAPVYVNVGPTTEFDGDIKILSEIVAEGTTPDGWETTIFFTDPTGDRTVTIPDADVTLGVVTGIVPPDHGGTGIANNAASTITITGAFATTITVTAGTAVTLPTTGIVVSDATACTDLEGTYLAIGAGVLNVAGLAESGANTDITSILNTGLYVGRDLDNRISWATDDRLIIEIANVIHTFLDIETGVGDNDSLVTQGYVDDAVGVAGATVALDNLAAVQINTTLLSDAADTDSLGTAAAEWLNLYIGDAGKIYIGLAQDLSIHRSGAGIMTLTAANGVVASAGLTVNGTLAMGANDITLTGTITTPTNISMTGELDMTGASATIDLNPASTGTGCVIDITPTATITAGSDWDAICFDGDALDPLTGGATFIHILHADLSGVLSADGNDAVCSGTYITLPTGDTASSWGHAQALTEMTVAGTQIGFGSLGGALVLSATATYRGVWIDYDGVTRDGNAPVLEGIRVELPAVYTNFGANFGAYFSGGGETVTICDGTYALNLSGDVVLAGALTGLTTPLAADLGGTGVANNAAETITMVGDDAIQFTTGGATTVTLPTSGTLFGSGNVFASGSLGSETDVAAGTYGVQWYYFGDNTDVTALRSRAVLKTTDASTKTAQGAVLQASNADGIDALCLNGALIEAIGKSDSTASTITHMRGALIGTEWNAKDTVTNLKTLHVRTHTRDSATEGYVSGTGYLVYLENEAVGGNGQQLDAGIYLKATNVSTPYAFDYGIDLSGAVGEIATAEIRLSYGETISNLVDGTVNISGMLYNPDYIVFDNTDYNTKLGYQAGKNLISGATHNTYIGYQAGLSHATDGNVNADYNIGIGTGALISNTGGSVNIAIGKDSLAALTYGIQNTGIGLFALTSVTTGDYNVAIGVLTLSQCNGQYNVGIGDNALREVTSTSNNTAIGKNAGRYHANGSTALQTPADSTYIGAGAMGKDENDSNSMVIGATAIGMGANTTVFGNSSVTDTYISGNIHAVSSAYIQTVVTMDDGDATPDVQAGNVFISQSNTGATAITDLDNPVVGQIVTIICGDATNAPTIADGSNFKMSAAWNSTLDDSITFFVQADNYYIEISRSAN